MVTYAEILAHCARKDRAWRTFCNRQRAIGAALDPRTGGDSGLIHNWGNEAARDALQRGWKRWDSYSNEFHARYTAMMKTYARQTGDAARAESKALSYRQRRVRRVAP